MYFLLVWITLCYSSFQLRNASVEVTQSNSYRVEDYDGSWQKMNESSCGYGSYSYSTLYPFFNSELIVLNHFSFDIPDQATITAIRQYWIVRESPDVIPRIHEFEVMVIKNVDLLNSTSFFTTIPDFGSQDGWQTFDATIEYPLVGNNLLWNTTWVANEINSNLFGVGLRVINPSGSNAFARVSCMYIEIEFVAQSSEIATSALTGSTLASSALTGSTLAGSTLTSSEVTHIMPTSITTIDSSSPINTNTFESTDIIESSDKTTGVVTLIVVSCCLGGLFLISLAGYFADKIHRKRKLSKKTDLLIPFETNDLFLDNVRVLEKIGEGNFGEVYRGKMDDTMIVACKVLKNETLLNSFEQNKEASILSKLNHENILRFYGIYNADTHSYLITEYIKMGSLHDFLLKGMLSDVSHLDKLTLILTIACGMHYLQVKGIIHGDLRAQNLLITKIDGDFSIKISDFGLAKHINQFFTRQDEEFIPIKWTAPEVIIKKEFSRYSDIWSFGVVMWEISREGELPYKNIKNKDLMAELVGGYRLKLKDKDIVKRLRKLVEQCWAIVPYERPDFKQAHKEIEDEIKALPSTELNEKIYAPLPLFNTSDPEIYNTLNGGKAF